MRPTIMTAVVAFLVAFAAQAAFAESPRGLRPSPAATAELPPAFRALGAGAGQVLQQREAEAVRGQWWLYMPLKNGTIYFQGVGPFSIGVWTESQSYPGTAVGFRLGIGK
jgi:hypothetical protein